MQSTDTPLAHGVLVYDEATGRRGTITDAVNFPGLVYLRPVGGGHEWQARREHLRPVTTSEQLADRLRDARTSAPGEGDWR